MSAIRALLVFALVCTLAMACSGRGQPTVVAQPEFHTARVTFVVADEIELRVYGEDELAGKYQVQDDGSIEIPLVGKIPAQGSTQTQLTESVRARLLAGYLKQPQVTVVVTHRQLREVSVLGQVNAPGRIPFVDALTLVQAISAACGFTSSAQARKLEITRRGPAGLTNFDVSVHAITRGLREDVPLQPEDIIFVPQSHL